MTWKKSVRLWCGVWFLCACLLTAGGCTTHYIPIVPDPTREIQLSAEQFFINGEFQKALLEFEHIYDTALVAADRTAALYGLACTQLILAQNEKELVAGIRTLQKWDAAKGSETFVENRHLLVLALKQQADRLADQEHTEMQRQLRQQRLIENQRKQIQNMVATVEKLTSQIEALEAIDEAYQKKRKPL